VAVFVHPQHAGFHRGDAQTGGVRDAFEEYLQVTKPDAR
jgi:hypothetical protein